MSILIKNVSVFDGVEFLPARYNILVQGNIIVKITDSPFLESESEKIIDGTDCTLLPGLIDLHVHLTWNGGVDPATDICHETFAEHLIVTVSNAMRYLPKGVTSVRDLGSPEDCCLIVADAINSGKFKGPRIYGSGQSIIMTGGHDPFHGIMVDGPCEALKAVRTQAAKQARVIKISATGGVYGRELGEDVNDVELRQEEIDIIIDEAHRRNIPVTAHAIGEAGIRCCLRAGIDCIEHGHCITEDMAEDMAEKNIAYVPTFYIYQLLANNEKIPVYAREKSKAIIGIHRSALHRAYKKGVLIGAGSDAGSCYSPHPSLNEELKALNEGGLKKEDVLKAATSDAAKILHESHRLGAVKEGLLADLVLVKDNPMTDWGVLDNPLFVIKNGELVFEK